jgi:alcohol dehydrogenase (cytochrome c)
MTMRTVRQLLFCASLGLASLLDFSAIAQVTASRLEHAASEPGNWMMYSGTYDSQRYSRLRQINKSNVRRLELQWVVQNQVPGVWQSNPLVVDGIMYLTQRPNDVMAVDAKTGKHFWLFRWTPDTNARVCCGSNNRGLAMLGDTLFMGTLDAHLIAIDAKTGKPVWNVEVGDVKAAYSITMAPLIVKDKVLVGVGGGEFGIRGYVAAYDAKTGKEVWRHYTVPAPGEAGSETWSGDDWKNGGAPIWTMGSYDPALNLVYFGTGNPGPDWNPAQRPGDNLYSDSVIALNPETGERSWYFQFTPHDAYDFDATQIPILADITWKGRPLKAMLFANRNGFFYVLNRATGEYLSGTAFTKVNWATGLDAKGRPLVVDLPPDVPVYPGNQGGTNWYPPAYSPRTGLFYFSTWENYASLYRREEVTYQPGRIFTGGGSQVPPPAPGAPTVGIGRRGPLNNWTDEVGSGATVAWNPITGKRVWSFPQFDVVDAGLLATASDIIFTGGREGYFYALDARSGKVLWKASLGGAIVMAPITYAVNGKQYVSVIAGNVLATFTLH